MQGAVTEEYWVKLLKSIGSYFQVHLQKPFTQEVLGTLVIGAIMYWHAQTQNLFGEIARVSGVLDKFELDDVLRLLFIASLGFVFIIYRRTSYLKKEVFRRKKAEIEIKKIAFYDSLTGLANRDLCKEKLELIISKACAQDSKIALLFIDIDNFKGINDSFGHSYGDELLRQVAARISLELREEDVFSRISGDEFVIVVDKYRNREFISVLCGRLLKSVAKSFILNDQSAYVSLSIGVSEYPTDGSDAEELLKQADTAMYQAKNEGKNTYKFFSCAMRKQSERRSRVRLNLRQALLNRELSVVYQPVIDVQTSKIKGAEALVRWNNAELGVVSPDEFIPIAEEIGMIGAIDDWVLITACRQNKQWQRESSDCILMSVNISASHLNSNRIVDSVTRSLISSELDPKYLELEVTETSMMKDVDVAIKCLEQLKSIGISLALDDFGTGYSSISYLRRFKLDRLKIDQSFIKNIPSSEEDMLTTSTIITLANNLNLAITAEGIETIEQLNFIKSTVCDSIQGYYFSKPVSANEFKVLLSTSHMQESQAVVR
ncbi:MAG: diguanylate cyclase (GGDEF)-like protein [Oceanospirillaceae bacterium]|jgi:diguanylate cyclase (GGDEF)-like protein